ncbi:MAG: DNA gyrase inhibitor YacG [Caulobacterales bacterium 32-69-10]|nr:MAG: DNA gyrase inhibitor YacG [Caulobacterales bacterium 32-69-10]
MSVKPACPICDKPVDPAYRPFCSRRCADVDLQRWFSGRYAVPAVETDDEVPPGGESGGD